jgi:leucyl aminopeptidase
VLAEEAAKIASTYSDVFTATILDEEKCQELKMGSYLGVAAASANPPRFIHLCYKPVGGNVKRKLAIVGKGLTFDRFVLFLQILFMPCLICFLALGEVFLVKTLIMIILCSGGYNIKTGPGCSIELMKFDMGGSAAVFGAAKALAQIKPPGVEVLQFSVTCE